MQNANSFYVYEFKYENIYMDEPWIKKEYHMGEWRKNIHQKFLVRQNASQSHWQTFRYISILILSNDYEVLRKGL